MAVLRRVAIALAIAQLLMPPALLAWLGWGGDASRLNWLTKAAAVGAVIVWLVLAARWDWLSCYLRPLLPVAWLLVLVASAGGAGDERFLPSGVTAWAGVAAHLALFLLAVRGIVAAVVARRFPAGTLALASPLRRGVYYVAQGGSLRALNHHAIDRPQRYALDVVKLNRFGSRARGLFPRDCRDYAILGDTLHSPCDGEVVAAVDGFPDAGPLTSNREHPAGNHVIIAHDGYLVILAHLMRGSVAVAAGATVPEGQPLGRVGNSGNTSEPHLHIHAVRGTAPDDTGTGEGVPIGLNGAFLVRNSLLMDCSGAEQR